MMTKSHYWLIVQNFPEISRHWHKNTMKTPRVVRTVQWRKQLRAWVQSLYTFRLFILRLPISYTLCSCLLVWPCIVMYWDNLHGGIIYAMTYLCHLFVITLHTSRKNCIRWDGLVDLRVESNNGQYLPHHNVIRSLLGGGSGFPNSFEYAEYNLISCPCLIL